LLGDNTGDEAITPVADQFPGCWSLGFKLGSIVYMPNLTTCILHSELHKSRLASVTYGIVTAQDVGERLRTNS